MSREFKSPVTKNLWEYAVVTVSTLIMVFGNYFFKFPNNFAFGGITGFSTIVSALTKLSASQFTFIANMVLLVMGFIFIGKGFGMKTVYSSVLMSLGSHGSMVSDGKAIDGSADPGTGICRISSGSRFCAVI